LFKFAGFRNMKMKKLSLVIIPCFILLGCADKKAQKKAALDSVINVHDKVMGADGELMKNKAELDTMIRTKKLPAGDSAVILDNQLAAADSAMDVWMQHFDVDQKNKSEDESIAYFRAQKKQITAIDSALTKAVGESTKYLAKIKTK
jgi:hypothetical protein